MLYTNNRARTAGVLGMFGASLFFIALLIEYHYGLFPPGTGTLYILNQVQFTIAMACILAMLWQMRRLRVGGNGRFARITLTIFPLGWALLIGANLVSLLTGNADSFLYPLGGLTSSLFGLLAGIAVAFNRNWSGWGRFALLLQGVYNLLVMVVYPLVFTGSIDPTLPTESLWMATWFLLGLALFQSAREDQRIDAQARTVG